VITEAPEKIFIVDRRVSVTLYDTFHETFLILRSIILFELSKGEEADPDGDSSSNKMQDKAGSPKSEISSDQGKGATDAKSEDVSLLSMIKVRCSHSLKSLLLVCNLQSSCYFI